MKLTKTIVCAILAIVMCVALVACSAPANNDAPAEDGMKLVKDGKLTMATAAGFGFYEFYQEGEVIGIDVDIATLLAEKLGLELVVEDMDFGAIVAAVETGKVDIGVAGLTVREDRLLSVDFTDPYVLDARQVIIVPEDSEVAGPADLTGKQIGVQEATTGDIYATDEFGEDSVQRFKQGAEAVIALTQGKVDAVIIDDQPASVFVNQNEGLKILDEAYTLEDYAIAVNKENTALKEALNKALAELQAEGKIDEIIEGYIEEYML